jgi:hypothetical protein
MTKQDDKRIAALAKKNAAKLNKPPKQDQAAKFDDTLRVRSTEQEPDTKRFFKEMKKREF